ncbi:NifU family protein [Hydrogenophaga sp.]|uniref:NifU family protein n=1 Tax=Hydrogenophaga sp. TaxID=1904254 RepID=UPI0015F5295A|nr:NifU family protein [Hydrogenophaga sp.]MBI2746354.1 NifU family protein [Burkholderiales bacterium]MBS3957808.1 NifU family protein [Xanthomonadaceae bacterium]MDO9201965.1 NifU family protein [Hydrogenophaga sp.]MDZ4101307.1 NifU family protein [Hydrogenophaga sp.]MDZ4126336.1 NifU family protein [Hydrogenophaga sp.]
MNAATHDDSERLAHMATEVAALQAIGQAWPLEQRAVLDNLRGAIEALHREALVRLLKGLRDEPAAAARLRELASDPFIYGVLRLHGLVREPLEARVRAALESVAPMLAEHAGGVELVAIKLPDTVEVRLTGSCQSCPASGQTLSEGVERAIKEHAPEIVRVVQVRRSAETRAPGEAVPIHFVSPFAKAEDRGFVDLCAVDELPQGQVAARTLRDEALLLYRDGSQVFCVANACAHLGMPLDDGAVAEGVIECPHHGFRYRLDTGECLDVPEVQLVVHAVRVRGGRVAVKLGASA